MYANTVSVDQRFEEVEHEDFEVLCALCGALVDELLDEVTEPPTHRVCEGSVLILLVPTV